MTRAEINQRFPKASESFIKANIDPDDSRLCPAAAKSVERLPLDGVGRSEETNWHHAAKRFEITFIVYSVRPADYDGYDIKALQDFLVKAGIIKDDRWDILAGRVVSRKAATQGEEKTEVVIWAES
jgi:hypothetical protein